MITFVKRYVVYNFGLKLLSLVLATGLWFIIAKDEQPAEVAMRAPIVFKDVPSQLEISTESIPEAQIRVRGPERMIRQLKTNEVQAELDLTGVKEGDRTFDLTLHQVRHPKDIEIVQIVPSQLHLAFDTRLTREVPVSPKVVGIFASGDNVIKKWDPEHVTISGPRRHVELISEAKTDPIDATGTSGTAVFSTNVYVSDPLVQVEQPATIRVVVTVQKAGAGTPH